MKVVTSDQMRTLERRAIEAGVPEDTLMENAGLAVARSIAHALDDDGHDLGQELLGRILERAGLARLRHGMGKGRGPREILASAPEASKADPWTDAGAASAPTPRIPTLGPGTAPIAGRPPALSPSCAPPPRWRNR